MATSLAVESEELAALNNEAVAPTASAMELNLRVIDAEVFQELSNHAEGTARDDFALTALRICIMAIRQAQGRIDADVVKHEGDRLVGELL